MTVPTVPAAGMTVLYFPGSKDGMAGNSAVPSPAIVQQVTLGAPDYGLTLSVIHGGTLTTKSRPPSKATWVANGSDTSVGYWDFSPVLYA